MNQMTTNTAEMRRVASELTDLNGRFEQQVGALVDDKTELCGMWEGEANNTFQQAFNKSYESLHDFYNVIATYVRVLTEIAAKYEESEARAKEKAVNTVQG